MAVHPDTAELLQEALRYCADSEGRFDITMGTAVRLWNFHKGTIPSRTDLDEALAHVDWRMIDVWSENDEAREGTRPCESGPATSARRLSEQRWFARIRDPKAAVDLGGIA